MNQKSPWFGRRVAIRIISKSSAKFWREVQKSKGKSFDEDCYWSFMWERGVVLDEKDGMALVTVLDNHDSVPVPRRVRTNRLVCFKCCGMKQVQDVTPTDPRRLVTIPCDECPSFPRQGVRWIHPKDEWGEAWDSDPSGGFIERHKLRAERINEQIRKSNSAAAPIQF